MKKYIKNIDTGIEWLKEIPSHWNKIRLRYLCDITTGNRDTVDRDDNGQYPFFVRSKTIERISTFSYDGEAILTAGDGDICKIWHHVNEKFDFHQRVYMLYNLKKINGRFLYYYIGENFYYDVFKLSAKNTVDSLRLPMFLNFTVAVPPLEEQTKIAQYLDHQTSIIDQLIEQKEKLIALLKEKRQAVINEAVTKGLDPNVKMKESGIEWLGKVPMHWELRNLETIAKKNRYSITGGPFGSDLKNEEYTEYGVRIIQLQNIGVGEFRDEYKIYTSEEKANYLYTSNIYPGEIIIAKMADPVARACIVPNTAERFIMASDGIRLEVDNEKHNTKFIEFSINAKYFNYQAELNSTGTTRLRIGLTTLKKLKLLVPKVAEQNEIVKYLESFNNYFLEITEKLTNQIEKLKEYRQSIISEAVTGKIDVRDWQPNN
jgi:type I restriction enzyme S subunit